MLNREQILAMPESEYMSPVQLDYFKQMLQDRLCEARARIADLQSQLRSVDVEPDITDQATVEEERSRTSTPSIACKRASARPWPPSI